MGTWKALEVLVANLKIQNQYLSRPESSLHKESKVYEKSV